MTNFWHRLSHLLGWNTGRVVSFWLDDTIWTGFRCDGCGEVNHAQPVAVIKSVSMSIDNPLPGWSD
jgi:hypothetical protein